MGEHDKRLPESAGKGSGDIDKLKKDLRDKIDQACKKEYNEALNLIDLYMSSVGIDKDIYVLRSKIVKQKRFQDKDELQPDLEKPKKNADEVKDLSIEYDMELEAPLEEGLGETSPTMVSYVPDSEPNGGDEPLDLSTPLPSSVRRPESRNEPVERPAAVHSSLMEELSVITDQNQGQMESRKPVSLNRKKTISERTNTNSTWVSEPPGGRPARRKSPYPL